MRELKLEVEVEGPKRMAVAPASVPAISGAAEPMIAGRAACATVDGGRTVRSN
jgi:hypothetical protein